MVPFVLYLGHDTNIWGGKLELGREHGSEEDRPEIILRTLVAGGVTPGCYSAFLGLSFPICKAGVIEFPG